MVRTRRRAPRTTSRFRNRQRLQNRGNDDTLRVAWALSHLAAQALPLGAIRLSRRCGSVVAMCGQHRGRWERAPERGVTLVETLVVLIIVALLASVTVVGSGSVGSSRLRGAATTVIAYSRVAITRTNATGRPVRMVFDLDKGRLWLEESASSRGLRKDPK